ncbi:MAG: glycoside hydrolase family 2 TIM barrel-domain containing protein [Armatimonadota bacterium]|nr:hypothetical protein [Armatimonadota bacterium]MCX7778226.1 hypothetical protein [Armatimonadota bacterium]MDW8024492.1 glycoside hydrolase family 2 TIM barrel-domain containing protein [Armatimonadota bacterium]
MRHKLLLDGLWDFVTDTMGNLRIDKLSDALPWRKIKVPSFWEAQFDDLLNYDGIAWYRRSVALPKEWIDAISHGGMRLFIHFEAVDYYACVFVGERMIGEHEGGYLPFEFELQREVLKEFLRDGELKITVQVIDPTNDRLRFPKFPADEIPMGKQSWYLNVGGIWQSVWLELRESVFVEDIFVTPLRDLKSAEMRIKFSRAHEEPMQCDVFVEDGDGNLKTHASVKLPVGESEISLRLKIEDAKPWHPETPNLYRAIVRLSNGDEQSTHFGLRIVECRNGKVHINGEPIYIIGALDQDFYADEIYRAPSDELLERQFKLAKEIGFNLLRCHLKLPEKRYLDIADRIGMLVWYELPSWSRFGERLRQRIKRHIQGMVKRDYNHPSLIAYGIVGESWGLKLSEQELHRRWLVETVELLRQLDGTRLIVDNSPCDGNFHIKTDINDFHIYCNSPDEDERFSRWLDEFDGRPHWTFSPHGDAQPSGSEPLIVSEFGIWGLPDVNEQAHSSGKMPWWFSTGGGACRPEGVHERFSSSPINKVFASLGELCKATRLHQVEALRHQIEEIRSRRNIVGYVITELTDVAWECNGVLDFERREKEVANVLRKIQSQDALIIRLTRECIFGGEILGGHVIFSHYSSLSIDGAKLQLRLVDEHGNELAQNEFECARVERGSVGKVAELELLMADFEKPTWVSVELRMMRDCSEVGQTRRKALVLPSAWRNEGITAIGAKRTSERKVFLYDVNGWLNGLGEWLYNLGTPMAERLEDADILIAPFPDKELLSMVSDGAKALCIAEMARAMPIPTDGLRIVDRSLKGRYGSWCTSFTWLSKELQQLLNLPPILPHAMRPIVPRCVIEVDLERMRRISGAEVEAVHSGLFVGWLHEEAYVALMIRIGSGRLLLTTFRLTCAVNGEPAAIAMLRALLHELSC